MQLTNPLENKNIAQEKSNETTEEWNSVNKKETKENESSSNEINDDDNDNTTFYNSIRSSTNIKFTVNSKTNSVDNI